MRRQKQLCVARENLFFSETQEVVSYVFGTNSDLHCAKLFITNDHHI